MGTRGAVAFGDVKSWSGVYNHSDSQPTRLGPQVWRAVLSAKAEPGGLDALRTKVMAAGDWAAFERAERAPELLELSNDTADPAHIEWVYVVDGGGRHLHVLGHAPVERPAGQRPEYVYDLAGRFPLEGDEPDWAACERAHARKHAGPILASIRARFGEDAYRSARRQLLGD